LPAKEAGAKGGRGKKRNGDTPQLSTLSSTSAERVGRAVMGAAVKTTGKVLPEGRPPADRDTAKFAQLERAKEAGVSRYTQQKLDAPDIADALARGEYPSARSAGIAAGIVKVPSNLQRLHALWDRASQDERDAFLAEVVIRRIVSADVEALDRLDRPDVDAGPCHGTPDR